MAYVELKGINKTFGAYRASDDINFEIEKGQLVALLGPSGSGKTTILKMLAGLENPDSGEIFIDGTKVNDIAASKRGIGFVFQNYALFRYKTVFENIAFGLRVNKASKEYINSRVTELIELVGLKGLEKRYPRELSGGQRQRVAFARAIATEPQLLLLDEPFAAIDAKVRKELRSWLRELITKVGITSIFVTHDQEEAVEVADQIILTNQGRIEQIGTPIQIYKQPETSFAAEFLGENVKIENYTDFNGFSELQKKDYAIIRPEYVDVYKKTEPPRFPTSSEEGIVEDVIFKGNTIELLINIHGNRITAYRQLSQQLINAGEKVNLFINKAFVVDQKSVITVNNNIYKTHISPVF